MFVFNKIGLDQGWARSLNGDRKPIRYNKIRFEISALPILYKAMNLKNIPFKN